MLIHDHNQWPQQVTASDPLPSRRLEAPTVRFNCAAQSQFQPRDVQHNSHQRRHLAVTVKLGHQPVRIIRWKIRGLPTMMLTERHTSITDGARNQSRNAPLGSGHAGCGTSVHSRSARSSASAPSGTPQCNDNCPKGPKWTASQPAKAWARSRSPAASSERPTSLHQSLILKFAHIGRSAPSTADSWKRPVVAQNCETSRKTQDFPAPCHTFERHDSVVMSLVSLRRRGRASLGA
jgi:hypothetical protein